MNEPVLTGAQRQVFEQAVEKAAIAYAKRTELKKWAMESALHVFNNFPPNSGDGKLQISDPISLAKGIYEFVRAE
jgi:hypothetical protein